MKRILFFVTVLLSVQLFAQVPTNQDCGGAIPVCQNVYNQNNSYSGTGNYPTEINSLNSCLGGAGEVNSVWYVFTAQTNGNVCFDITPNNSADDYDWGVYDLSNNSCAEIYTNPALEVSCNFSGVSGVTGANGSAGAQNETCIPVVAGQTLYLAVQNWSGTTNGYTLDFGSSSATIFDNVPPSIQSVNLPIACGTTSLGFDFTENILCSSLQAGDFTLTGPGGPYTISAVTGPNCAAGGNQESSVSVTVSPALTVAGAYSLCLTNSNGSVQDLCGNVAPPGCLNFNITNNVIADAGPNVSTCSGVGVGIGGSPTGSGSSGYSYAWTPAGSLNNAGIANPTASPTTSTTYTVVVTDAGGCSASDQVNVTVTPAVTPTFAAIPSVCQNAAAPVLPTTSTNGINGSWSPAVSTATVGTQTYTFTPSAGQCATTTTLDITINPQTVPTFAAIPSVCQNAVAPVLPTTSTNGINGSWSPAVSTATVGTQTYTFTPSAGQCATTTTLDITINPLPVPTVLSDSVNCNGGTDGSVTVTGITGTSAFPGGYSYSWSSGDLTQTSAGLNAGGYTVTVTDLGTSCAGQATVTVFEPGVLTATNTPTNPTCAQGTNGSITANPSGGTGNYTYSWTPGGQTTQTATGLSAGILYTCTITDHNNCTVTTSATLTDPPGMVLDTSTTLSNCGAADGSATVSVVSGGSGNFTYSWNTVPVQTTATATGIPAGTYTATVTDVTLGCVSTINAIVPSTSAITAVATLVNDVLCNGDATGIAYATSPDGAPTLSFLWDDSGASTNDTLTAVAGTYNVTITDGNGCTGTDVVTIGEPTLVVASITASTDETCLGANNGTATAGGAQGTGGYTYSWNTSPIQTTQTATGLAPGTYTVYVYDDNLCVDSASVTINAGALMTSSNITTDVTCFNGTNGSINVTINGAPGPITYAWTPSGGASEDPVGLSAGVYYLTATSGGCSVQDSAEIFEPTQLVAVIDSSFDALCAGASNGSAYASVTGGIPPYTYLWDAAAGNQTTASASGLLAGNYVLTVSDSNNNCSATVGVTINEPAPLDASMGDLDAYCGLDQGMAWVIPLNGTAPYTYLWDSTGTTLSVDDTLMGVFPGLYNIGIIDDNGCKFNATVTVGSSPAGVASISSQSDVSCNGGSDGTATVSMAGAYPGYTYAWDAAAGNQTVNPAIGLSQGSYNVNVTDTFGCVMSTSVTINEPTVLTVDFSVFDKICPDSCNATVNAVPGGGTAPYSYLWNDPSSQVTQTAINLCSGFITLTLTDDKNCTVTDSVLVDTPLAMIVATTTDSSSCNQADGNAYINVVANGIPPYTYGWTDAANNIISTDSTLLGVIAGTYYGHAYDSLGCSVVDTVTIYDESAPQIDSVVTSNVLCYGGNTGMAEVYVSGGEFPYTYLWDDALTQTASAASNLVANGYTVVATDANGCVVSAPVNISEPADLALMSGGVNPSCADSANGSVWVNVQGGMTPYSYEWNSNATLNNDTIYNLPELAGGYSVTVTDSNNCTAMANVVLVDPALFTINVSGIDVDCAGSNSGSATVSENNGIFPFTYLWDDVSAQTTQTASGLIANTYNVTVTDDAGCKADGSVIINEPDTLIITLDTIGNVTCNGLSDGYAEVNVIGGSGVYSYEWTLGAIVVSNVQNPNGLAAGLYSVVVTDTAGCTDQMNVNITEPNVLAGSVIGSDAKCHGDNTGFAYATNVTGGTAPYTYQWDDLALQETDTAFNLLAGTYSLIIKDSLLCEMPPINIVIAEPDSIVLVPSTVSSTCGLSNGSASVSAAGGTPLAVAPFYNYLWNSVPNQGTAVATGLSAGGYQVIVTDAQGCTDSIIANVTDLGSPTVVMDSITNVTCNGAGDGMAYASVSGGIAPYTYLWTNGDTTLNATNLNAQSYTITVTDDNGCIATEDTTIQENAGVVVVAHLIQNVSCNGGSDGIVYANGNGGTGATTLTYTWNDPLTQANDTAFDLMIGTYIVEAIDLNNCKAYDTVEVIEPLLLTTTLDSLKNLTCYQSNDGYIDVSGVGGTLPYSWYSNAVGGPTLSGLVAGDYYLVVEDAKGCIDSTNYTVTEPADLVIQEITTASTCGNFNGSAEVTSVTGGTGPYNYSWNDPLNQQTALASSLLANTYTVTVSDYRGCSKDTTVVVLNTPGSSIDSVIVEDVDCYGKPTGSAEAFVTGSAPFSYSWTPTGQTTALASSLVAGVYSLEVTDANQCVTTQSGIVVNQPTQVTANITMPSYACYGQVIQLYGVAAGGTPPYSILWGAPFGVTTPGPLYDTITSPMTYNIGVTDANGCGILPSESISVGAPLTISPFGDEICLGDTANIYAIAGGGDVGSPYQYTWMEYDSLTGIPTTPAGIVNPTSTSNIDVYAVSETDYIVTVEDGCSSPITAGMTVIVKDTAVVSIISTESGCPIPDSWSIGFEVQNDVWNSTYSWNFGDGGVLSSANDSVSHSYFNSGTFDVTLLVTTQEGCTSTFIYEDEVTIYPVPEANFTKDPFEVTMLNPTYEFADLSSNDVIGWDWNFGDLLGMSIEQNPFYTYQDTGIYPVTLIVTNGLCEDTITKKVKVKPEFLFLIPNSFTPQADGLNEIFMPGTMIGVAEKDYNFFIYDRWGEVIYEGHDLDDGWDGYYKGALSQTGVYVYYVKLKGIDGLQREFRGHVNLLR